MGKTKRDIVIVGATIFVFAFLIVSKNVFRSIAPPGAPIARVPTPSADAATFVDDTQAEFDAGTHGDTQWSVANTWVELTATGLTNKTGTYTSSVKDSGTTSSWDTFAWTPQAPYGKELPNSAGVETAYPGGNADMTGNKLLLHLNDEVGTGGTITDNSGVGNNGTATFTGAATCSAITGKLKKACNFDSSGDYLKSSNITGISSSAFTVEGWVKFTTLFAHETVVSITDTYKNRNYFQFGGLYSGGIMYVFGYLRVAGLDMWLVRGGTSLLTNTWYHVAITKNGTANPKLYLNGDVETLTYTNQFDKTKTLTDISAANAIDSWAVGTLWANVSGSDGGAITAGNLTNGYIDEIAFFDRELSATEIADHYRRGGRSLKFQMRSCDDSACSGETLVGPDGTASDYYEELDNTGIGAPSFTITNISNNRYFQYKAFFDTDTTAAGPTLKSVTPSYTNLGASISGTVYTDEGTTAMTTTPTVRLKVNGLGSYSTTAAANGTYTISSISGLVSGDVLTLYLDGATEKAALVTRYGSGSPSGIDLYQNRLILRHEEAGPITNANIGQYDKDDDTDLHFTSNASALTVDNDTELHIPQFYLFTPGGAVTTSPGGTSPGGDIHIGTSATFTAAANAVSVGGSWDNNGTYTISSGQTTTFTATGTGKTVEAGSSTYQHVTFNGSGGGWTVQTDNMTVAGNLSLTTGGAWTLQSGRTLEVRGTFTNSIPSVTTWTGSTLYFNSGTSYTVGSKTQAAETYGALQIGADTTVRMWNASSTAVTTP